MADFQPKKGKPQMTSAGNKSNKRGGKRMSPQQMLETGINGVLNSNSFTALPNMVRTAIPQIGTGLKEGGKIVNSTVDAIPGARDVLNHPGFGVVTQAVPGLGALLGTAGVASQVAGSERASNPFKQKPAATAQPPKRPGAASLSIPPSAAQPGTGPAGNQVGDPPKTSGDRSKRTTPDGLVSYGKDLSSLNAFTKSFTGVEGISDINTLYASNALPTTPQGAKQGHEGTRTNYSWDSEGEEGVWNDKTGRIETPSSPGTTGGNPNNSQDGTSSKPDVADNIRAVRMARKGPRDEGTPRGFNGADFSGSEPDNSSLTSPMYKNAQRNKIRSTFLDHEGSSVQAIAAANAVAGYGKDWEGNAQFNVGGKLVTAKDGMQQKAKNAAMMGQDPREFLDIPATPEVSPDQPAASEIDPVAKTKAKEAQAGAQTFLQGAISQVKGRNK